jgi:hypothetical protein
MPKYNYSSKHNTEPISSVQANTLSEAVTFFSQVKDLPQNQFLELYEVHKERSQKST